ncbi:MAG: hypothetical protein Fur007_03350 [Rhodoferax sp.]
MRWRTVITAHLWVAWIWAWCSGLVMAQDEARPRLVGVLAFQNLELTRERWAPTAKVLSQAIPGPRFLIVPLSYEQLDAAAAAGALDFVLTNPEHYVVLRNRHSLRPLATLSLQVNGTIQDEFGSAIFTRADSGIGTLEQVRGHTVAAVGLNSLGGYLMGADRFLQQGIRLRNPSDVRLTLTGVPHSRVVQAVVSGQADVGIVRTGVLEELAAQGQLDLRQLRQLDAQPQGLAGQWLSTDLYPEWPWAAGAHISKELARAVTLALLNIAPESPAAHAGHYAGFSTPANYSKVEELMRRLDAYPGVPPVPLWQWLWRDHQGKILALGLFLLLGGLLVAGILWRSNRRLRVLSDALRQSQADVRLAAAAFESQVGLIVTDPHTRILRANAAMAVMLGYSEASLRGRDTAVLRSPVAPAGSLRLVWAAVQRDHRWQGELLCRHQQGHDVLCRVTINPISPKSAVEGFIASFVDVTEQRQAEARVRELAYYDPLTRLPNRRMAMETLETLQRQALARGRLAGVMFLDLDFFKDLNDAQGHTVGDQLLRLIAQRLKLLVGPSDLVARLGGDEFILVLADLGDKPEPAMTALLVQAQRVHEALLDPFDLDTTELDPDLAQSLHYRCSGSIGVALFGQSEESLTEVLKRADVAMYKAKRDGRNLVRAYDPAAQQLIRDRMALSNDLNSALANGEISLYYQLQVDMLGQPVGAECLLRWRHPTRGFVSPAEFIPLAEDSGVIVALGEWALERACQTLARWAQQPLWTKLNLSVNVSPRQFREPDFCGRVRRILLRSGAAPTRLRLELTEGIVMQDSQRVIGRMLELCAQGLSFSVDDFGTGYSSLAYMKQLPLAELKIDQSFVRDLDTDERAQAIVRAIIALGHSMAIELLAEGVETPEQAQRLCTMGCGMLQGYWYARPEPLESFENRLATMLGPNTSPAHSD